MRKAFLLFLFLFLFLFILCSSASAEDEVEVEVAVEEITVLPEKEPKFSILAGYRFIDIIGSERAVEYEYPHDSIMLGGDLRAYPLPHRLHIDFDINSKKDYFGELRYSYHDIIYFRGIIRSLFHNLDNIRLQGPQSIIDIRDSDERYGIRSGINTIFLRLKAPDFPAHVYIDGSLIERKGSQQQRSLLGSGWYDNMVRTSQKRDIDWQTRNITIGANSHLGPVEIDFSHTEKRFDVNGDRFFSNNYTGSTVRPAGEFPHNLIPEIKGSTDTLKIHTSYTGRLTASATFTKMDRENTASGARVDYFIGSGEMQWLPMHELAFFLKYRHKDADINNPDTITITDMSNPLNSYTYNVKPSVSYINDTVSGAVRYRPINGLTLRAEYFYDNIRRQNNDRWHLPDSTEKHTVSLSADARILRSLNLKARYIHKEINSPAFNIEPDRSDEGRLSVLWMPMPKINALLSYSISREKRDKITCAEGCAGEDAENRNIKREKLLGSITFLVFNDLSITTSYSYMHNRVEQDIVYSTPPTYGTDKSINYKDTASNYALDINYILNKNINLNAGISHTTGKGFFRPSNTPLISPSSVAEFSEFKMRETVFRGQGEYSFKNSITLGLQYKYSRFNDVLDNPHNEIRDGRAHIVLLTISKGWK